MANTDNLTKDMSPIGRALFESFAPLPRPSETDRLKAVIDRVVWEREALNTKVITMLGALEACKEFVAKEVETRGSEPYAQEATELAGVISSAIKSGRS